MPLLLHRAFIVPNVPAKRAVLRRWRADAPEEIRFARPRRGRFCKTFAVTHGNALRFQSLGERRLRRAAPLPQSNTPIRPNNHGDCRFPLHSSCLERRYEKRRAPMPALRFQCRFSKRIISFRRPIWRAALPSRHRFPCRQLPCRGGISARCYRALRRAPFRLPSA